MTISRVSARKQVQPIKSGYRLHSLVCFFLVGMIAFGLHPAFSQTNPATQKLEIEWKVAREQVKKVKKNLHLNGSITGDLKTAEPTKGLPLIYIFAGTAVVSHIVKTVITIVKDLTHSGIIIDARGKKLKMYEKKGMNRGEILVIGKDGTHSTLHEPTPTFSAESLLNAIKK